MGVELGYSLTLVTGPDSDPVTLAEAKLACRIQSTSEDDLIESLISAAREQLEADTDRKFLPQTWLYSVSSFPASSAEPLAVPISPMIAVTGIEYDDANGDPVTLSSGAYRFVENSCPGLVYPVTGSPWPVAAGVAGAVRVTVTAGWPDADSVPQRAKQAIKLLVGHWYQNRELATDRQTKGVEMAYERLAQMLRPGFW